MANYLYNSNGDFIAFRIGKFIYNTQGEWIGWMPWGDNDVVDVDGEYMGTITDQNRFYFYNYWQFRGNPGYPGHPGFPGYPGTPARIGHAVMPTSFAVDVEEYRLKNK